MKDTHTHIRTHTLYVFIHVCACGCAPVRVKMADFPCLCEVESLGIVFGIIIKWIIINDPNLGKHIFHDKEWMPAKVCSIMNNHWLLIN